MQWRKRGVVFKVDGSIPWMRSHAMLPTPFRLDPERLRIYLSFLDEKGMARVGYVDLDAADPARVLHVSPSPCLDIGEPGGFDDNGVVCTSVIRLKDGRLMMYFVGFELSTQVRYRLLTGAAISEDGGETFTRVRKTAVLERSDAERYFRCGPFVTREGNLFRMWYIAGSSWMDIGGKPMPVYDLRYVESANGIDWPSEGRVVMQIEADEHGFGRPWIVQEDGRYKLHYSIRKIADRGYRLGYAESSNGLDWQRMDAALNLGVSPTGWDSEAIMYSAVISGNDEDWLFYNGNNFGETGLGLAVRERT